MNAQELKKYLVNNEIDVQSAYAAFGMADWVFRAYSDSSGITGIDHDHVHCYFGHCNSEDVFYQLISRDDIKKVSHKIYDDYLKDPDSLLKDKIGAQHKLMEEMDESWREYENKQEISDEKFFEIFKKITDLGYEWWKYGVIGEDKAEVVAWEVVPRFQKRHSLSYEEAREAVSVLAHPDEMAVFNQERKKFFEICLAIYREMEKNEKSIFADAWKNERIKEMIDGYQKDFFWIKTNFYEAVKITEDLLGEEMRGEVGSKSEKEIEEEIHKIDKNFIDIHKKKEEVRGKYSLGSDDLRDIEFSQAAILWFDQRKLGMMRHLYYIYSMMREIPKRKGIDYHTCTLYFVEELLSLLKEDNHLDMDIISSRKENIFLSFDHGKRIIYSGCEASEMFDIIMKNNHSNELKGVVASRGGKEKIRGIVNIIIRPDKNDFEEGKILVTSMTRIEFVPLMKKALAIITNEGGLACHAAIVSRELGIPAIIGTKSATKFLKNGDEIEMDLKTGEIKILE
jgi:phosphohistidine swiveling domain-containing protein